MNSPSMIRINLYRYELPLLKPMPGSDGRMLRKGLLIEAEFSDGRSVCSEAAPLPGFSRENLEESEQELRGILSSQADFPLQLDVKWLREVGEGIRYSSVRFAVEVLILKCWAMQKDRSWPFLFCEHPERKVAVNGLLEGKEEHWPRALDRLQEQGVNIIKVKLGKQSLYRDLEMLGELSGRVSEPVKWRFDANGAWSLDEAVDVCHAMERLPVDYLEEPLKNPRDWDELVRQTNVPLALDENLAHLHPSNLKTFSDVDTVVLKPTLRGGVMACMDWVQAAQALGIRVTFTSAFESWLGVRDIAALQSACGVDTAAGLGTLDWFVPHEVLAPPNVITFGEMHLSGWHLEMKLKDQPKIPLLTSWPK